MKSLPQPDEPIHLDEGISTTIVPDSDDEKDYPEIPKEVVKEPEPEPEPEPVVQAQEESKPKKKILRKKSDA